jgi:hypothetical protein
MTAEHPLVEGFDAIVEQARRDLLPTMPAELAAAIAAGEPTWTTAEMQVDFEPLGFQAPLIVVRRRSDGQLGSLQFTHSPRTYFGWEAHS